MTRPRPEANSRLKFALAVQASRQNLDENLTVSILIASVRAARLEFIDENGDGLGVRLRKRRRAKPVKDVAGVIPTLTNSPLSLKYLHVLHRSLWLR